MVVRDVHGLRYLAVVPLAIATLAAIAALGVNIPNQPGVLLLAVAYCAYRGGVAIGLAGALIHVAYTAYFFSDPHHLLAFSGDNLSRVIVIAVVAPVMGLMVGLLRREAFNTLAREKATERALTKLNAELEERVLARTAELTSAQAQAQMSEERIRAFAESASDWFWEQDENLRFSYFSSAAFGGSHETAAKHLGKTRREVGTAILSEAEWDAHEADLLARRPFRNLVTRRITEDGTVRYTSTSGKPFFDAGGKFRGYRGTARDVTQQTLDEIDLEHRVAERTAEVRALQQKLLEQERRATLDQLTATVSHELRNPLSAIRNSVYSIAQSVPPDDAQIQRPLDRINRSIQRCENIIAQLVEYSQLRELQCRSTTIDTWLDELLDHEKLPDGIMLARDLNAAKQIVSCDADQMRKVIAALIENAVQAIERVRGDEPNGHAYRIVVSSRREGNRLEIAVKDDGPGIERSAFAHIFEPLFSTKAFGVGLGLPLVKQIMDYHGGGIDLTSELGKGTQALLWLPIAEAASGEIAA
jgi:PAS domain S-box-containing protein